jgi:Uncharacterised nucleotidyltransferase
MAGLPDIASVHPASPIRQDSPLPPSGPRLISDPGRPFAHQSAPHFSRSLRERSERLLLSRHKRIREALLLTFCDPIPKECLRLCLLTPAEWQRALQWLDVSGLALYFLDRVDRENLSSLLPEPVIARLRQNLADNTVRTAALIADWTSIQRSFQNAGLSFATLKGFSLGPPSVPRLELRSQVDLDFLVAEASAHEARRILEARGLHLRAISGRSWEFAAHDAVHMSLRDLYRATPHRFVELHVESAASPAPLLQRVEMRRLHGLCVPVLDPVDLFLGQGLHIFKHLSGEFTRVAHILEFRRHVMARSADSAFWLRLRTRAEADHRHPIGLGVVVLIITRLMGDFAPAAFTGWTVDRLTPAVHRWIERCGHDAVFAGSPGTKLYLLLQEALASAGIPAKRPTLQALFPRRLPAAALNPPPLESLAARLRRRRHRLRIILIRARFHLVEGFRYRRAARLFRKDLARS